MKIYIPILLLFLTVPGLQAATIRVEARIATNSPNEAVYSFGISPLVSSLTSQDSVFTKLESNKTGSFTAEVPVGAYMIGIFHPLAGTTMYTVYVENEQAVINIEAKLAPFSPAKPIERLELVDLDGPYSFLLPIPLTYDSVSGFWVSADSTRIPPGRKYLFWANGSDILHDPETCNPIPDHKTAHYYSIHDSTKQRIRFKPPTLPSERTKPETTFKVSGCDERFHAMHKEIAELDKQEEKKILDSLMMNSLKNPNRDVAADSSLAVAALNSLYNKITAIAAAYPAAYKQAVLNKQYRILEKLDFQYADRKPNNKGHKHFNKNQEENLYRKCALLEQIDPASPLLEAASFVKYAQNCDNKIIQNGLVGDKYPAWHFTEHFSKLAREKATDEFKAAVFIEEADIRTFNNPLSSISLYDTLIQEYAHTFVFRKNKSRILTDYNSAVVKEGSAAPAFTLQNVKTGATISRQSGESNTWFLLYISTTMNSTDKKADLLFDSLRQKYPESVLTIVPIQRVNEHPFSGLDPNDKPIPGNFYKADKSFIQDYGLVLSNAYVFLIDKKGDIALRTPLDGRDGIFQEINSLVPKYREIYQIVEDMPRFPGCEDLPADQRKVCADKKMMEFVNSNIKYPAIAREKEIEGQVIVTFVVEGNGTLSDLTILRSIDPLLDEEALRIIRLMNTSKIRWIPGKQRGLSVLVKYYLPIRFSLAMVKQDAPGIPPPPPPPPAPRQEEIFKILEEMPRFPGCEDIPADQRKVCTDKKMMEFVNSNIKYPALAREKGIEGQVVVTFVVELDGSLTGIKVLRSVNPILDEEALRVINQMNAENKKWIPGKQRGLPVRVQFHLPIPFKLN